MRPCFFISILELPLQILFSVSFEYIIPCRLAVDQINIIIIMNQATKPPTPTHLPTHPEASHFILNSSISLVQLFPRHFPFNTNKLEQAILMNVSKKKANIVVPKCCTRLEKKKKKTMQRRTPTLN